MDASVMRRLVLLIMLLGILAPAAQATPPTYTGEDTTISCIPSNSQFNGHFGIALVGNRRMWCAPDGHPFWPNAPDIFARGNDRGAYRQNIRDFSKVYLLPNGGSAVDVTAAAADTNASDVVMTPAVACGGVSSGNPRTVCKVGDTIYLGSVFPPIGIYTQLGTTGTLGASGTLPWQYYAPGASTWRNVDCGWNGSSCAGANVGKPKSVNAADSNSSYELNVAGNTPGTAPSNAATTVYPETGSNWMQVYPFQNDTSAWPSDFTTAATPPTITGQSPPANLYWMRAVVTTTDYSTAPLLSQITEEEGDYQQGSGSQTNNIELRYGVNEWHWYNSFNQFLLSKGWDAAGESSTDVQFNNDPCWTIGASCTGSASYTNATTHIPLINGALNVDRGPIGDNSGVATLSVLGISSYIKNISSPTTTANKGTCVNSRTPQIDAFDPQYLQGLEAYMECWYFGVGAHATCGEPYEVPDGLYYYAIDMPETDWFTIDKNYSHDNLGAVVAETNPYFPSTSNPSGVTYSDVSLYSKYDMMGTWLPHEYNNAVTLDQTCISNDPRIGTTNLLTGGTFAAASGASNNAAPTGACATALSALNTAWGTSYTTWGTSSGTVAAGTNAYGTGTGLLDENGSHTISNCGNVDDYSLTSWAPNSTIATDLTNWVQHFSAQYFDTLHTMWNFEQTNNIGTLSPPHQLPPLLGAFEDAPDVVIKGAAPYVDAVITEGGGVGNSSTCSGDPYTTACVQNLYDRYAADFESSIGHGLPILVENFSSATSDSQNGFEAVITSSVFSSPNTTISFTGAYPYHDYVFLQFPDSPGCTLVQVSGATWQGTSVSLTVSGNYSTGGCLGAGTQHVKGISVESIQYDLNNATKTDQGLEMYNQIATMMNRADSNGEYDLAGYTHWSLYDSAETSGSGVGASWSLASDASNFYDGVQACSTGGTDANGYPIGGEIVDNTNDSTCFGDVFGSCSTNANTLCGLMYNGGNYIYPRLSGLTTTTGTGGSNQGIGAW